MEGMMSGNNTETVLTLKELVLKPKQVGFGFNWAWREKDPTARKYELPIEKASVSLVRTPWLFPEMINWKYDYGLLIYLKNVALNVANAV